MIRTRMRDCKEIHWTTLMIIFWAMTIRTILMILTKTVIHIMYVANEISKQSQSERYFLNIS